MSFSLTTEREVTRETYMSLLKPKSSGDLQLHSLFQCQVACSLTILFLCSLVLRNNLCKREIDECFSELSTYVGFLRKANEIFNPSPRHGVLLVFFFNSGYCTAECNLQKGCLCRKNSLGFSCLCDSNDQSKGRM